jgi:hypothetical protein
MDDTTTHWEVHRVDGTDLPRYLFAGEQAARWRAFELAKEWSTAVHLVDSRTRATIATFDPHAAVYTFNGEEVLA